jgi:hypothetical protein
LPPSSFPVEPGEEYICPDTSGEDAGSQPDAGTSGDAEDAQPDTEQPRDTETDGTEGDVEPDGPSDADDDRTGERALSGGASSCSGCSAGSTPMFPPVWLLLCLLGLSATLTDRPGSVSADN